MKYAHWVTVSVLVFALAACAGMAQKKSGREDSGKRQDPERALTALIREMQMDLESGSGRGFLSSIDSAKFEDYPRFEDMIERLTRDDSLRVYFRQSSQSIKDNHAQTIIDAEMELVRKDSAARMERRRQQIVIDFEATSRGWKIVNITPREFFRPL